MEGYVSERECTQDKICENKQTDSLMNREITERIAVTQIIVSKGSFEVKEIVI